MTSNIGNHFNCSVVVTCFNSENTIAATLQSLLNQSSISPEKVLIIDDGSVDKSVSIASSFPFELFKTPKNLGEGGAKQFGFERVKSEFVAFLDSDDTWDPNFLEMQQRYWREVTTDVAAIGFSLRIGGTGAFRESYLINQMKFSRAKEYVDVNSLWERNPFTSSATVYRTHCLSNVGGYSTDSPVADYETITRLGLGGYKLLTVPFQCGDYGLSASQISANPSFQLKGQMRVAGILASTLDAENHAGLLRRKSRELFLKSLAKCANYNLPSTKIPDTTIFGDMGIFFSIFYKIVKVRIIWNFVSEGWRRYVHMKFRYFQLKESLFKSKKK